MRMIYDIFECPFQTVLHIHMKIFNRNELYHFSKLIPKQNKYGTILVNNVMKNNIVIKIELKTYSNYAYGKLICYVYVSC